MVLFEIQNEIGDVFSKRIQPDFSETVSTQHTNLKIGDDAPDFTTQNWINLYWINLLDNSETITLAQLLLEKPLILTFLDNDWSKKYISSFQLFWEENYQTIQSSGANLLMLNPQSIDYLPKTNYLFHLAQDTNKEIAQAYGVYSKNYPIWDRISGVDNDVMMPSVFVINQDKKIVFIRKDEGFKLDFGFSELLKFI
ncbi:MAG: redoxin domain-containing protein [Microscillaceae bacterium]|nr:redoxin domain-containing protein [Microscillaceae bacterium]